MLDGMSDSIQRSRIENLHSREVNRQSPTGLILLSTSCVCVCVYMCSGLNLEDEQIIARRIAEKSFHVNMPSVLRLLIAFGEVLLSHSATLCYFAMVLNTLMYGSILSLLFPISIFFWAMLSVPRPKKSYWVTIITYTEVCVLVS